MHILDVSAAPRRAALSERSRRAINRPQRSISVTSSRPHTLYLLTSVLQVSPADLAEEAAENVVDAKLASQITDTTGAPADQVASSSSSGDAVTAASSSETAVGMEAAEEAAAAAKARGERVARQRELSVLDSALKQKEKLLASMQASDAHFAKKLQVYEEQVAGLTEKIARIEAEREQLMRQLNTEAGGR